MLSEARQQFCTQPIGSEEIAQTVSSIHSPQHLGHDGEVAA